MKLELTDRQMTVLYLILDFYQAEYTFPPKDTSHWDEVMEILQLVKNAE